MISPTIITVPIFSAASFSPQIPANYAPTENDFIVQSLGTTTRENKTLGWVALKHSNKWFIEESYIYIGKTSAFIEYESQIKSDAFAYPIDPSMTRQDIEGATEIYPNATNTGWLFAHATEEDHHERVILLEAIMHTLFEDEVHSKLEDVLKKVVGSDNPSPQAGTALLYNYNSQFGSLSNYSNLVEFRKECVKWCSEVEKLLHVGQHIQESDHRLKHQLVRAIKQAKLIWKADTGKARNLATIESQVDAIIARVEADHEIDTRWVKAEKRAKAEAARKAAEAAAAEGDDGNGS